MNFIVSARSFTFVASLALVCCSIGCSSGQVSSSAGTLGSNMKAMGSRFKKINQESKDPSKSADLAVLADEIAGYAQKAKTFTPKRIDSLSADIRTAKKAEFEKDLDQLTDLARELAAAFRKSDMTKVQQTLQKLKAQQKEGHDEFAEEEEKKT